MANIVAGRILVESRTSALYGSGMVDLNNGIAKTAAILAIGDELLSGRTRDSNIHTLAVFLDQKGIELKQVRIVADEMEAIGAAINALRASHDYVFTSGGIGPTHDDITVDALSAALEVDAITHPEAERRLQEWYAGQNLEFTPARRRMARTPDGATLIDNPVSVAPGMRVENIFVLAGVPAVFRAMIEALEPQLVGSAKVGVETVDCSLGEGTIGDGLGEIAGRFPTVSIGSYPRYDGKGFSTQIVLRSRDDKQLSLARDAVNDLLANLTG